MRTHPGSAAVLPAGILGGAVIAIVIVVVVVVVVLFVAALPPPHRGTQTRVTECSRCASSAESSTQADRRRRRRCRRRGRRGPDPSRGQSALSSSPTRHARQRGMALPHGGQRLTQWSSKSWLQNLALQQPCAQIRAPPQDQSLQVGVKASLVRLCIRAAAGSTQEGGGGGMNRAPTLGGGHSLPPPTINVNVFRARHLTGEVVTHG